MAKIYEGGTGPRRKHVKRDPVDYRTDTRKHAKYTTVHGGSSTEDAVRIAKKHVVIDHGFNEGDQVYFGTSKHYDGVGSTDNFLTDVMFGDLSAEIAPGDMVAFYKLDGTRWPSEDGVAVRNTNWDTVHFNIDLEVGSGMPAPEADWVFVEQQDEKWRLASADHFHTLKSGMVHKPSKDSFLLVTYGYIDYDEIDPFGLNWKVGEYYYLHATERVNPVWAPGEVQKDPPVDIGKWVQYAFEVMDIVPEQPPNLISDPWFETGAAAWGTVGGVSLTPPTATFNGGLADLHENLFTPTPGTKYKVSLVSDGVGTLRVLIGGVVHSTTTHGLNVFEIEAININSLFVQSQTTNPFIGTVTNVRVQEIGDPPLDVVPESSRIKVLDQLPTSIGGNNAEVSDWLASEVYDKSDMLVVRNGLIYRALKAGPDNKAKDPALITVGKEWWFRLTPRTFAMDNDPLTTATEWQVIDGDLWIDTNAVPGGGTHNAYANIRYLRDGNKWLSMQGNTRVINESDAWAKLGKGTELIILDEHGDDGQRPVNAIELAFIDRAGSWQRAKLWNMPWGYHTAYSTGTTWSVDFYGGTPVTQSVPFKKGRSYMVQWGIVILNDTANAQAIDASVKIAGSTVAYDKGFAQNYNAINFGSMWFYHHSGANSSQTVNIWVSTVSHQIKWAHAWFYITDQGPA